MSSSYHSTHSGDRNDSLRYNIKKNTETDYFDRKNYVDSIIALNQTILLSITNIQAKSGFLNDTNVDVGVDINGLLNTSIARAITYFVPLIPLNTPLNYILSEITSHNVMEFLIKRETYVQIVTARDVFEYMGRGADITKSTIEDLRVTRVPFVLRSMRLGTAMKIMIDRNLPLLLIEWSDKESELMSVSANGEVHYPNVVTLSQIYLMMSQLLVEHGIIPKEGEEEENNKDETKTMDARAVLRRRVLESVSCRNLEQDERRTAFDTAMLRIVNDFKYRSVMCLVLVADTMMCLVYILMNSVYYPSYVMYLVITILATVDYLLRLFYSDLKLNVAYELFNIAMLAFSFVSFFLRPTSVALQITIKAIILSRIVGNVNYCDKEKASISSDIRKLLSKNRNHLENNLDMTYITSRIIAMSWPGNAFESVWRNNMKDVEDYLNDKHMGHYWVINLCAEGEYSQTGVKAFGGRYTHYCIEDHNTCSIEQIKEIVQQCTLWLAQDPVNVVVIHCKGGKGRTGMIIACLLMKLGIQYDPASAMKFFAMKRTQQDTDNVKVQAISCPSQMRSIYYYNFICDHIVVKRTVIFQNIEVSMPATIFRDLSKNDEMEVAIYRYVFANRDMDKRTGELPSVAGYTYKEEKELLFAANLRIKTRAGKAYLKGNQSIPLSGDIKIILRFRSLVNPFSMFLWFNTDYLTHVVTDFTEPEIDTNLAISSSSVPAFSSASELMQMESDPASTLQTSLSKSMASSASDLRREEDPLPCCDEPPLDSAELAVHLICSGSHLLESCIASEEDDDDDDDEEIEQVRSVFASSVNSVGSKIAMSFSNTRSILAKFPRGKERITRSRSSSTESLGSHMGDRKSPSVEPSEGASSPLVEDNLEIKRRDKEGGESNRSMYYSTIWESMESQEASEVIEENRRLANLNMTEEINDSTIEENDENCSVCSQFLCRWDEYSESPLSCLGQFVYSLNTYYNKRFGTHYTVASFHSYKFWEVWLIDPAACAQIVQDFFVSPEFTNDIPIVEGSTNAIMRLKEKFDIFIITSRHTCIEEITRKWVDKYFHGLIDGIYIGNTWCQDGKKLTKREMCQLIHADVMIDDNWDYINECKDIVQVPILFGVYGWNRKKEEDYNGMKCCKNWDEVLNILLQYSFK